MRIDKMVADAAALTRSIARKKIKGGAVSVNGNIVKDIAFHVSCDDEITIDGQVAVYREHIYIMLNKPAGYVSATEDKRQRTVLDLLDPSFVRYALFPCGRLDIDTEGFLLLTNDGELAHNLLSPSKKYGKTYFVRLENDITSEGITALETGIDIGECITKPATVKKISANEIELTITEGKFHQIKRMAEKIGNKVVYLRRLAYGKVFLDETLETGEYRFLTDEELSMLKKYY